MPRTTLVRQVMTTDVLTFRPTETVEAAARALTQRRLGGAPVVDEGGKVVGLLEDDDLIVQDTQLHMPTVISLFGGYIELPSALAHFERDLRKAAAATVADVMDADAPTCGPEDTLEMVATALHESGSSRMAVIDDDGNLVGVVSRGDLVRAIVGDTAS
ncbi:MAG TPA: CBS domain-containing protein [Acidimicrobiales bacterium]|nr:CBS domain-containing protein [Acidimicrobiales bacterium]